MECLNQAAFATLEQLCPGGIERDVDLSAMSQWRIGGLADVVISPGTIHELAAVRRYLHQLQVPQVVIGLTSNLLFADEGLRAPCIKIGRRMASLTVEGSEVHCEAGIWVPQFAVQLMRAGLAGGEHTCGIPGTLGGLVCMNGGSQRKGIGSNIISVESVDHVGRIRVRSVEECQFSYRSSIFQRNEEVVARARLSFEHGDPTAIRADMRAILAERRRKFPRKEPNCGSVFKSDPAMYDQIGAPGVAIERAGLKGLRVGAAQISPRHANFIVNTGGARARDVLTLVAEITDEVFERTSFRMVAEASYVTPSGRVVPVDLAAQEEL